MPPRRKPTDEERNAQSARRRAQRTAVALNDPERHAEIRVTSSRQRAVRRAADTPAITNRRLEDDA